MQNRMVALEKRVFMRHPVKLKGMCGSRPVEIRDCCPGGMFLALDRAGEARQSQTLNPSTGDVIEIRCSVPTPGGEKLLRFQGYVVRTDGSSAGVAFVTPDFEALYVLHDFAKKHPPAPALPPVSQRSGDDTEAIPLKIDSQAAQSIMLACKRMIEERLEPLVTAFLKQVSDRLFSMAEKARSGAEQNACFNARDMFTKKGVALKFKFKASMKDKLDHFPAPVGGSSRGPDPNFSELTLSVVEKEEFEAWLAFSGIARKVESEYQGQLADLEQRLTMLSEVPIDRDN